MKNKIKILEKALQKNKNNSAEDLLKHCPALAEVIIKQQIQKNISDF